MMAILMSNNKLRIKLDSLPHREKNNCNKKTETPKYNNSWGKEGDKCERNCDCLYGLICDEGICTENW